MWQWMWKFKVPHRIWMFIWLLLHGKLLTNATRFHRHMTTDPHCMTCETTIEGSEHILRRCPSARQVWTSLKDKKMDYLQDDLDFTEWFFHHARGVHEDANWATKFIITLWYIWKWRCTAQFNTTEEIPFDKGEFLL